MTQTQNPLLWPNRDIPLDFLPAGYYNSSIHGILAQTSPIGLYPCGDHDCGLHHRPSRRACRSKFQKEQEPGAEERMHPGMGQAMKSRPTTRPRRCVRTSPIIPSTYCRPIKGRVARSMPGSHLPGASPGQRAQESFSGELRCHLST